MSKKALVFGSILCVVAGCVALSNAQAADVAKGKALYTSKCMICHGAKGDGTGPGAMALSPKPANYNSKEFWKTPNIEQKIAEVIKNGKGQMAPFPDLSSDDINSIVLYIEQTFKPK